MFRKLILDEIEEVQLEARASKGWLQCDWSDELGEKAGASWARFGGIWYRLQRISKPETGALMVPVLVKGRAIGRWPDEGNSGVAHLFRHGNSSWVVCWPRCPWILHKEFEPARAIDGIRADVPGRLRTLYITPEDPQ